MGIVEQNVESKEKAAGVKKDVASEDVSSSPTRNRRNIQMPVSSLVIFSSF